MFYIKIRCNKTLVIYSATAKLFLKTDSVRVTSCIKDYMTCNTVVKQNQLQKIVKLLYQLWLQMMTISVTNELH